MLPRKWFIDVDAVVVVVVVDVVAVRPVRKSKRFAIASGIVL